MSFKNIAVPQSVILSPTRVEGGLRCARKHVLSDILGITPNDHSQPALDFGEALHQGAATWWASGGDFIAAWKKIELACSWPLNTTHTLALARKCFEVYVAEARLMPFGDPAEWEIDTIEERETIELHGHRLSFQVDRRLRNVNTGAKAPVDLKTASKCDKRWENQWPRKLQMRLYDACHVLKHGTPLQWLIIEGLEKTKPHVHYLTLPDRTDEQRTEALRNFEWIAEHDSSLLDRCRGKDGSIDVDTLLRVALTETPYNDGECWSYNSPCQYLGLCDAEPSQRLALLNADYHHEAPKHLV